MLSFRKVPLLAVLFISSTLTAWVRPSVAAAAQVESRIVQEVNESERTRFSGNTHRAAVAPNDLGVLEPDVPLTGVRLLLKRSAAQDAALKLLMAQQADPKSANFHHWLTPEQYGTQFGPSDADLAVLTDWLSRQGLVVTDVNKGRTFIQFSGTAALIGQALHTEMHRYLINGEEHVANNGDPSIPAALSPVVAGVASLNDFHSKPQHHDVGAVRRNGTTGKWTQTAATGVGEVHAQFTTAGLYGYQLVSPQDFAAIYNILPLWNAGIDGTGQTIAIAGRSDINLADVASFRKAFGLPVNVPRVIVNGADPGSHDWGEALENTLDVEWSGAIAKGAQIVFVTTASTNTDGAQASALYIIENRIAPVLSFSYGLCERDMGTAGNAAYNALWQQAAAEGISVFVASGDLSAAGCDYGASPPFEAQQGLAVSGTSSTPFNTAVGGTDFNWMNLPSTQFWTSGGSTSVASALQYIPEVPWNASCGSQAYQQTLGSTFAGQDSEQFCNYWLNGGKDLLSLNVYGAGGGMSACTNPTSSTSASCAGGYVKPTWQTGTGVPADGHRDVPDVSLFAANGDLQTAFVVCDSQIAPCNYADPNNAIAQAVGGTSVSSPAMAGIMALVNQKMGAPQGNANAGLYALAARDNRANCNTVTVSAGNACNFYDITTGSNSVPCVAGTLNCVVLHSGDQLGMLAGNRSGVGYDTATGLGSVNATNLVNNWHLAGSPVSQVRVPNTVGSAQRVAIAALNLADLGLGAVTQQTSTAIVAGSIISQSPAAGSMVAAGTNVSLVMSSGAPVTVPNEVGLTQVSATASLKSAGVAVGTIMTTPNGCFAVGIVMSQSPVAGTVVSAGSSVSLNLAGAAAKVIVPSVTGVSSAFATSMLSFRGLKTGAVTQATTTAYDAGTVMSQTPAAGTSVASCSSVSFVVSSGPPPVKVPNSVGYSQAAAMNAILGVKLAVGRVTQQASTSLSQGYVISENPASGTSVAVGSAVNLVVSSGAPPVLVPNEIGATQAVAQQALVRLGFKCPAITQTSTSIAAGSVISENPVAGTLLASGSTVNLVISSGRPLVQVPSEAGLTQALALASLSAKGLVAGTVSHVVSTTVAVGLVVSQSPLAGASVPTGTAVNLVLSSAPAALAAPKSLGSSQVSLSTPSVEPRSALVHDRR